jgi:hypothetical protein
MNSPTPTGVRPASAEPSLPRYLDLAVVVELLLKRPAAVLALARDSGRCESLLWLLLAAFVPCTLAYGAVLGTFSGGTQLWAAPLKLVGGLLGSALLCLPSLYIATCLSGRDATVPEVVGTLLAVVTLTSVLLLGFAPAAWLFSVSTSSLGFMGVLHLLIWLTSSVVGLRLLWLGNPRSPRSGHLLLWTVMFLLVGLQMSANLRPLLGTSERLLPVEKRFFLAHWWTCLAESERPISAVPSSPEALDPPPSGVPE